MAKAILGQVEIDFVEKETIDEVAIVTNKPVEDNTVISDTMRDEPLKMTINGVLSENAAEKLSTIRGYKSNKTVISYVFRNSISSCVVKNINRVHNADVPLGLAFTMTIQEVQVGQVRRTVLSPSIKTPQPTPAPQDKSAVARLERFENAKARQTAELI